MMLLGQESIRDVILFPQLRPKWLKPFVGRDKPGACPVCEIKASRLPTATVPPHYEGGPLLERSACFRLYSAGMCAQGVRMAIHQAPQRRGGLMVGPTGPLPQ